MQNKPNFQNAQTNATTYAAKTYRNIQLPLAPKKQTQSNPISQAQDGIRHHTSDIRSQIESTPRNTRYENKPNPTTASRSTLHASRDATSHVRLPRGDLPRGGNKNIDEPAHFVY